MNDEGLEQDAGGRILIVDDNPTNVDLLLDYLTRMGYQVMVAEDGLSALERISYQRPDIVLLDVMMPKMDGFETCQRIQENADTADIPVIFMTALDQLNDKVRGFGAGAVDYITKPFQNEEVLARIRSHLAVRRMQEDLLSQNERLAEQNEALDAYARTVAHDLKNPLNLIVNFARFVQDDYELPEKAQEDVFLIIQNAERMNHIIHDLLLLAQMRKSDTPAVPVHMKTVVEQSVDRLQVDLDTAGVKVELPRSWPDVMGHASWIQAVWVNYMSNAIKYGGDNPQIRLFFERDTEKAGSWLFGVEDKGAGVPEHMQHKIFEEFSRVGQERSEGHGIGLSIVRRIVTRLGGRVGTRANSENRPGSTFYFTLQEVRPDTQTS